MTISQDTWRLVQRLRLDVAKVTDAQTRDLVASWARAWDEVAGDLDAALQDLAAAAGEGRITRAMLSRSARLTRALSTVGDQLQSLGDDAGVRISTDLRRVVELAASSQTGLIGSQLPKAGRSLVVDWGRSDPQALEAMVKRLTQQVHKSTRPLARDAEKAMKRELVRGLASGRGPRETARRIVLRSEGTFNGGLTRALTISRTETIDAMRAGSEAAHRANADVLRGWVWTAELDKRTCPACFGMHGTEHELDESGPDGHQNCRCARTPVTKSWRDLGFDLDEPDSALPDAAEVFDGLDQADQVAILGRGRYQAWQAGKLPMSAWAVRQSNSGWRDSVVPVRVPTSV